MLSLFPSSSNPGGAIPGANKIHQLQLIIPNIKQGKEDLGKEMTTPKQEQ